jgi:hypothetical protein
MPEETEAEKKLSQAVFREAEEKRLVRIQLQEALAASRVNDASAKKAVQAAADQQKMFDRYVKDNEDFKKETRDRFAAYEVGTNSNPPPAVVAKKAMQISLNTIEQQDTFEGRMLRLASDLTRAIGFKEDTEAKPVKPVTEATTQLLSSDHKAWITRIVAIVFYVSATIAYIIKEYGHQ